MVLEPEAPQPWREIPDRYKSVWLFCDHGNRRPDATWTEIGGLAYDLAINLDGKQVRPVRRSWILMPCPAARCGRVWQVPTWKLLEIKHAAADKRDRRAVHRVPGATSRGH